MAKSHHRKDDDVVDLTTVVGESGMAQSDKRALLEGLESKLKNLPEVQGQADAILNSLMRHNKGMGSQNPIIQEQVQEVISMELEQWIKTRLPQIMTDTMKALNPDDDDIPS